MFLNMAFTTFMLALVFLAMISFVEIHDDLVLGAVETALGEQYQDFFDPASVCYAMIIQIIGYVYEKCSIELIEWHNYRYRKDYNDHLSS